MTAKRHKNATRTFGELTFAEGARTINAAIVYLERAMEHNISLSSVPATTRAKRIAQLARLKNRIIREEAQ